MNKITIKIVFCFLSLNIFLSLTPNFAFSENSFNKSAYKEDAVEIEWGDRAEIIDHPVYGVIVLSKDRWKNWVFRSLIIIMAYLSLLIVILSIPKTSELNLIVAYILSGSAFVVSFWETLSGWMLTRLNSYKYGWSFILISIPMYLASYFAVIRVKKNDISYSQIKEEFKKMQQLKADSYEDRRLLPISGVPGDWEDEDFIRRK